MALQAAAIQRHVAAAAAAQASAEEAGDAEALAIAERDSLRAQLTSIPIVSQAPLVAELQAAQVGLVNENGLLRVAERDAGWRARAQATRITRLDAELARLVQATVGKHNAAAAARALHAAKEAKHFLRGLHGHAHAPGQPVAERRDGGAGDTSGRVCEARGRPAEPGGQVGCRSQAVYRAPAGKDVRAVRILAVRVEYACAFREGGWRFRGCSRGGASSRHCLLQISMSVTFSVVCYILPCAWAGKVSARAKGTGHMWLSQIDLLSSKHTPDARKTRLLIVHLGSVNLVTDPS